LYHVSLTAGIPGLNSDLVDTFLLPSLVTAIMFMASQLWIDRDNEQAAIIRVLKLIILTRSKSSDANSMLPTVLTIVAKSLEEALRAHQPKAPADTDALLKALKEYIPLSRRTAAVDRNELEPWTSHGPEGITTSVREKFQAFTSWSLQPEMNMMPTSYTHRQLLAALQLLGAKRLLAVLLDEIKHQMVDGNASMAFDVAVAIICAPTGGDPTVTTDGLQPGTQRFMTLRQVLKSEAEECRKTEKTDPQLAEATVRLHRLVEAQMAPPTSAVVAADSALLAETAAGLGLSEAALDMAAAGAVVAAAAAAAGGDPLSAGVDLGGLVDPTSATSAGAPLDFGGDGDMFGASGDFSAMSAGTDFSALKWPDDAMEFT
jgi:mediator of RNA polymerase II transcription subunit 5